jgi:hypothetical protein
MLTTLIVLGVVWIGIVAAIWLAFVPASISVTTFGWLSAVLGVAVVAVAGVTRGARPTRSIAHLLYDVEHPSGLRR